MRIDRRRHSAATMTVWSLAAVGFFGMFTWYMGWLPISVETPATGKLADQNAAELDFPNGEEPFFDVNRNQQDFDEADPVAFNSQGEPPVREGSTTDSSMFDANGRDEPESNDPPFRPPSSFAAKPAHDDVDILFPKRGKAAAGSRGMTRTALAESSAEISPFDANSARTDARDRGILQIGGEAPATTSISAEATAKIAMIDELLSNDKRLAAHRELSTLYWVKPDWRPFIKDRIEQTAHSIYFSDHPHYMQPYEIQPGDRLQSVAKQYNVPWEYLVRLNRIDPRRIRPGQKLKVIKGPFSARLDLSDFELTIHAHGYFVHRFRVGIGRDDRTPIGRFKVLRKLVNPTYYGPDGNVIDANDSQNPLGERWIDIGDGFGIHGTINPQSIGRAESKGCIRLLNDDVEVVYDLLGVGSEVVIRK